MAKNREINMNLPSADDLFTTQEERDHKDQEYVKDISIYEITDFPNHPFKVKMDDKMLETIESVRDHGVLVPALVREKPTGGYEMISGHRRKMASELAGLESIPCIVMTKQSLLWLTVIFSEKKSYHPKRHLLIK